MTATDAVRLPPRLLLPAALLLAVPAAGQGDPAPRGLVTAEEVLAWRLRAAGISEPDPYPRRPVSRADSLAWERARAAAVRAPGRKIVVSLFERRLWLVDGADTLLSAPAAIGRGKVTDRNGRTWDFSTPRGRRTVLRREADPVWTPPDWHFVELAQRDGRRLVWLRRGTPVPLSDGSRLAVRGDQVGRLLPDGTFEPAAEEQALIFDGVLYAPPLGTRQRRFRNMLGPYKLELGDGYLIHGAMETGPTAITSTHGCIRIGDAELERLYESAPAGTPVFIY